MDEQPDFISLALEEAQERGDTLITRALIEAALKHIEDNKLEVPRYPNGTPTMKVVFDLAKTLSVEGTKS